MAYSTLHTFSNGQTSNATYVIENYQQLAADEAGRYRKIFEVNGQLNKDRIAGTYYFTTDAGGTGTMFPSTTSMATSGNAPLFYWDDADYTLTGLTQKLRLRFQVASNATAIAVTLTAGLYPITVAGGADQIAYTLGTVVSGSTVEIASPSASTVTSGTGSDFTIPSDGAYTIGVVTSGTQANNNLVSCHVQLQMRAVA